MQLAASGPMNCPNWSQTSEKCLSGGSLIWRAESGAEHLAQLVISCGTKVQIVRDGWDHQAAIHAGATYSLDRPEPVCRGGLQEWTVVVD